MILTVAAATIGPVCVGVIGTYIIQQRARASEKPLLATHSSRPLTQSNMIQAHQLQSIIPPRGGLLLGALRALFPRRAPSASQMRVVDSVALGPRDRALVIEIGDSWVLVGQGANGLSSLGILRKGGAMAPQTHEHVQLVPAGESDSIESTPAALDSMTRYLSNVTADQPQIEPILGGPIGAPVDATLPQDLLVGAASAAQDQPATGATAAGDELTRSVTEMREMITAAAKGEMPASVARDEDGFPDVIEAVRVVAAVEPGADAAASEPAAPEGRSFLQTYAEVKNNA